MLFSTISADNLLNLIQERWREAEQKPGVFRYKLDVQKKMFLEGRFKFFIEVISDYCKTHHQVKPFSHIAMELFQEVAINGNRPKISNTIDRQTSIESSTASLAKKKQFDEKSDTDSGRSSDHGEAFKDSAQPVLPVSRPGSKRLEIKRMPTINSAENSPVKATVAPIPRAVVVEPKSKPENVLQVVRRKRRRETFRRNTIDVNRLELAAAQQRYTNLDLMSVSKSTNCIDKILLNERNEFHRKIEEMSFQGGLSLPDLTADKLLEPKSRLIVKRPNEPDLKIRKCISTDDFRMEAASGRSRTKTGPDFLVKAHVPSKQIDISDDKGPLRRFVNVLLLNGNIVQLVCNPNTVTTRHIVETVFRTENYEENYFLGLCVIIGGDFVFLPMDLKLYKVAAQGWTIASTKKDRWTTGGGKAIDTLSLFIRIKFYLPTLRGLNALGSRHMLYLQLRKSVLEKHILCTDDDLITLGGFSLQAEVGDFLDNMKYMEYFTISHYLPEDVYQKNRELAKYLRNSHYVKRGLHPLEAEHNFIRYVQEMKEFGLHLYSAVWAKDDPSVLLEVFLAISISGICLFERNGREQNDRQSGTDDSKRTFQRRLLAKFEWLEIENLCYSKHMLCVAVRSRESLNAKENSRIKYKLRLDGRKSYFAFCLASEHHRFYMKLRNSFVSLKEISDEFNVSISSPQKSSDETDQSSGGAPSLKSADGSSSNPALNIDKPTKSTGQRMKNVKKSMLNDNKLIKLRQKFLKRSKSVTELSMAAVLDNGPPEYAAIGHGEEFKENLNPEPVAAPSPTARLHNSSCQRNRVKMGTRVFSQQFLNRSYDNICDNVLNMARLEAANGLQANDSLGGGHDLSVVSFDPIDEVASAEDDDDDDDAASRVVRKSREFLVQPPGAYVVHESINSSLSNYYAPDSSVPEESTMSSSLLEKFNNMSATGCEDRIIKRLVVDKDVVPRKEKRAIKMEAGEDPRQPQPAVPKTAFERLKLATFNSNRFSKRFLRSKKDKGVASQLEELTAEPQKYSLGVSIVQGSDNNVYVKELVPKGAGDRHGIKVGDQILSVNGKSLLLLSYDEALALLQTSGATVELVISQIVPEPPKTSVPLYRKSAHFKSEQNFRNLELYSIIDPPEANPAANDDPVACYFANMRQQQEDRTKQRLEASDNMPKALQSPSQSLASISLTPRRDHWKSVPDLQSGALPKIVAIVPKRVERQPQVPAMPRSFGLGRRYTGPVRYPVTPGKESMDMKTTTTTTAAGRRQLSLPVDQVASASQVFI